MSTPSLAALMNAKRAIVTAPNQQKWSEAQIAEMQAELALMGRPPLPTPDQSRQGPAPQTVSPSIFPKQELPPEFYTNDPKAVLGVRSDTVNTPQYYAELQKQIEGLASQVPAWKGKPVSFYQGSMVDPSGVAVDLRDEKQVAPYLSRLMNMVRAPEVGDASGYSVEVGSPVEQLPGLTVPREPTPPPKDAIDGLVLKSTESDPSSSTYMRLPAEVERTYGISGVDTSNLSIGEKLLLRRMGVKLPKARRR